MTFSSICIVSLDHIFSWCGGRSEDNFWRLVLSSHHEGPVTLSAAVMAGTSTPWAIAPAPFFCLLPVLALFAIVPFQVPALFW